MEESRGRLSVKGWGMNAGLNVDCGIKGTPRSKSHGFPVIRACLDFLDVFVYNDTSFGDTHKSAMVLGTGGLAAPGDHAEGDGVAASVFMDIEFWHR